MSYNYNPCVGCGYCCLKAPCSAASRIFGDYVRPCPFLEWRESRYYCKLTETNSDQKWDYRQELAIGAGCCSSLNTWRTDVKNRTPKEDNVNMFSLDPLFQIFLRCLGQDYFITSDKIYLICSSMLGELEKKGLSKEVAEKISFGIVHPYIKQWRSKQQEGVMG